VPLFAGYVPLPGGIDADCFSRHGWRCYIQGITIPKNRQNGVFLQALDADFEPARPAGAQAVVGALFVFPQQRLIFPQQRLIFPKQRLIL
jgi:hypothetical protein